MKRYQRIDVDEFAPYRSVAVADAERIIDPLRSIGLRTNSAVEAVYVK
jgi:hypothetical protein